MFSCEGAMDGKAVGSGGSTGKNKYATAVMPSADKTSKTVVQRPPIWLAVGSDGLYRPAGDRLRGLAERGEARRLLGRMAKWSDAWR